MASPHPFGPALYSKCQHSTVPQGLASEAALISGGFSVSFYIYSTDAYLCFARL